jgi:hypothetical protein
MHARMTAKPSQALAWSALLAITLMLASLLHALAASAFVTDASAPPSDVCLTPNPVTAALADGDDVRARYVASLCGATTREISEP